MVFAGCSDEGPAHSHYHNCFLRLFNQLDLVDIVFAFFWYFFSLTYHFLLPSSTRLPCASAVTLPKVVTPGSKQDREPPHPLFLLSIFVIIRRRHFCLCRPDTGHTEPQSHMWTSSCEQHPPTPPAHPADSRYLYPRRSLLPQDKTPSIQNQTRKYFCFYFTKQLLICF